ncbi:DUF7490 domain-containing protein [Haladaptatus sp. NG-WS-4]
MNRERTLAGGIVVVAAAALIAAAVVLGAIADTPSGDLRTSHFRLEEMTISSGEVSGSTATLTVETRLAHRGGPAKNVTVLVRATHLDSGLVETTTKTRVPTIDGDRETSVTQNVSVERRGGYRIETVVFRDGERVAEGGKEVRGVGTLQPAYARTDVAFHWQDETSDFPSIEYAIADVPNNRTTLDVSTYLTNRGDDPSENVRVVFRARQAESNIVTDRATVSVGEIAAGRTASPSANLTVPDGYNYYLDAVLWKDGVVVGATRSAANLDPSETLSVNETHRSVELSVSDFEGSSQRSKDGGTVTANDAGQPGFTALPGIAALLVAGALAPRKR